MCLLCLCGKKNNRMLISEYQVIKSFRSPSTKLSPEGKIGYAQFNEGDYVLGYIRPKQGSLPLAPAIIVNEMFPIPLTHVQKIKDVDNCDVAPLPEPEKNMAEKISAGIKESIVGKTITQSSQATKYTLIGAAVGCAIAIVFKKNILAYAASGAIGGYIVSKAVTKK